MLTDKTRYQLLKYLESHPEASQRELAGALGISLGKANYCLRALIEMGVIKAHRFRKSQKRLAYVYLLTPKGLEEKARVTIRFLKTKVEEYEQLERELEGLRVEVQAFSDIEES